MSREADERITLRHGAGGPAMRKLIEEVLTQGLEGSRSEGIGLAAMDDGAAIRIGDGWLVLATDSHVVHPFAFPGGDIGRLAVAGTVNDLAMMGATSVLGLTCSVILEEGFRLSDLVKIQESIRRTSEEAGATVLTGDTKVMGRGELDGIVLNTAGIAMTKRIVPDTGLRVGDRILVTGTVGDHGFAVLACREGLEVEGNLRSDVAPLNGLVKAALDAVGNGVTALKDPTRGGLASALQELASKSGLGIVLDETAIPVTTAVRAVADLLGIDPTQVANEGKALIGVDPFRVEALLDTLQAHPLGRSARVIGTCVAEHPGSVVLDTGFGRRLLTELEGELLPRIC